MNDKRADPHHEERKKMKEMFEEQGKRTIFQPFLHVSSHKYYGDNFISKPNPNPRYKVSIISHQY